MITNTARLGLIATVIVSLGAFIATPALAHTRLIKSTPGRDSTVTSVPEVSLTYSDKIQNAKVLIKDGRGRNFASGKPEVSGVTVTQQVSGKLPAGTYTIVWRVVGEDGHPIQSENPLKFTVDAAAEPPPTAQESPVAQGDTMTQAPNAAPRSGESDSDSGGGAKWLMIGSGLLLGLGIGLGFVFLRKRNQASGSGGPSSGE